MGYMLHHAIVVTSWDIDLLKTAHQQAQRTFDCMDFDTRSDFSDLVSPIIPGVANGGGSFFIAPDGSKEGWGTSDTANDLRDEYVAWLRTQVHDDGSSSLDWGEFIVGGDDDIYRAERHHTRSAGVREAIG